MMRLKKLLLNEYLLVFLFCLAVIHGPAFSLMDNFDQSACIDCQTYLGVAELDLDQSPVRRYRPIVPLLAGSVNFVFGRIFSVLAPKQFPGNFPLTFSFYLVNCILLSIWGVIIYRYCKAYTLAPVYAIGGLLVMLSCRWTPYIAGTPLADSLYCLVLGLVLLGIKEKNEKMVLLAIYLGPFAKESFIFIAPLLFFFSHVGKLRQLIHFSLSGILVFSFRYAYDYIAGLPPSSGLEADLGHLDYVLDISKRLFSFHGAYDVMSNFGLWLLFPLLAFWLAPGFRLALKGHSEWYMLFFMASVFVHMVLSSSFERMFYLAMPLICLFTGLSIYHLWLAFAENKK